MNRETLSVVGVVLALAGCFYLYKELNKVKGYAGRLERWSRQDLCILLWH